MTKEKNVVDFALEGSEKAASEAANKFKNLQLGIYEFLMASEPEFEADADMNESGRMVDCSNYIMAASETAMAQLAEDMGAEQGLTENAWEAIQRHMGNIIE